MRDACITQGKSVSDNFCVILDPLVSQYTPYAVVDKHTKKNIFFGKNELLEECYLNNLERKNVELSYLNCSRLYGEPFALYLRALCLSAAALVSTVPKAITLFLVNNSLY